MGNKASRVGRLASPLDLLQRIVQPLLNLIRLIKSSVRQSSFQYFYRWRQYEHSLSLWESFAEFFSALDVDVQKWDSIFGLDLHDRRLGRSIEVTMYFKPLNEQILLNHFLELFLLYEIIVLSINLAFSRISSRERYTESELARVLLGQVLDQSSFTDARRANNDEWFELLDLSLSAQIDFSESNLLVSLHLGKQLDIRECIYNLILHQVRIV